MAKNRISVNNTPPPPPTHKNHWRRGIDSIPPIDPSQWKFSFSHCLFDAIIANTSKTRNKYTTIKTRYKKTQKNHNKRRGGAHPFFSHIVSWLLESFPVTKLVEFLILKPRWYVNFLIVHIFSLHIPKPHKWFLLMNYQSLLIHQRCCIIYG
jgi:hypothetical protein